VYPEGSFRTRPETIELARSLARKPKGKDAPSLRAISATLARRDHVTTNGTPYAPTAVKLMLRQSKRFKIPWS
jgi:hypothetical protein